jgi:hypothetical protein
MNTARVVLLNPANNLVDIETDGWMLAGSSLTVKEGRAVKAKNGDWVFGRLLHDVLPPGCLVVYEETKLKKIRR